MSDGILIICENRKARHNYQIDERFEAGMVLMGTEVKALREGKASLADSYAVFKGRELFLLNAHIPPFSHGNLANHEPLRSRKLLLHKSEIHKLYGNIETRGFTLIPLKMYFKKGRAKVEIALARGKKMHDKRDSTKEREARRQMDRVMKKRQR